MLAQLDQLYIKTRFTKAISRLVGYAFFEGRPLTTRGQWINSLVFALFSLEKRLPAMHEVQAPIFILGTGRSGTTVLGMVLSMHREVAFLNEPKALWHTIHSEEDLIGSYSRGGASYRLGAGDATEIRKLWIHRIYGAYLAATLSSRVVDKYPELIFRMPFVQALFPDAKFLFLIRNGWDTCRSIKGWSDRLGGEVLGEVHDWWGAERRKWRLLVDQLLPEHADLAPHQKEIAAFTNQSDMAAVEWIVTMREGLELLDRYPDQIRAVRYEDLCIDPEAELRLLSEFLGLSDDPKFLEYGKNTLHSLSSPGALPLHPSLIDPFNDTMRRLGYEVR